MPSIIPEYGDVQPYFKKMGRRVGLPASELAKNGNGKSPEAVLRAIPGEVQKLDESTSGNRIS